MLGSESLKNYFKNSSTADVRPIMSLEFNGNDYGYPYLYGTKQLPPANFSSNLMSFSSVKGAPAPSTVNRGMQTAINPSSSCQLIKVTGNRKTSIASDTLYTYRVATPTNVKTAKFHMFLKSDYTYQRSVGESNVEESFDVFIRAYGVDANNKLVRSETVSENIEVNSIEWQPITVMFANPDEDVVKVYISIELNPLSNMKECLLVSQLCYTEVSDYEVFVKNRLPLSEVFETERPGEFMVDMPSESRPHVTSGQETFPQQCTSTQMVMSYALGPKYQKLQRSITPFPGNPYSYFVSGSTADSKFVWALYKNKVKTNKIVLKVNAIAFNLDVFSIKILTSNGWSDSIVPENVKPDEHGILVLYYDGTSWSDSPWDLGNYPHIEDSPSSSLLGEIVCNSEVGYQEIFGIALDSDRIEIVNTDFEDYGTRKRLEIIELSPRLEIDVTEFIQSISIDQELSSDNFILPIGGVSSNSLRVLLYNAPINNILETDYTISISNISSKSNLKNLLRKGVKAKVQFAVDVGNTMGASTSQVSYIPSFTGYLDSWADQDYAIDLQFYDAVKKLQSLKTRPIYLRGHNFTEIISAIFDTVGFGEFYSESLNKSKGFGEKNALYSPVNNDIVRSYWTNKEVPVSESLYEICKVFQIAMYSDGYGGLKFKSLHSFNEDIKSLTSSTPSKTPDLYVQDFSDNNGESNLIDAILEESPKPESIIVKYYTPTPSKGQAADEDAYKKRVIERPFGRDTVWSLKGEDSVLPYIQIAEEGIRGAAQKYIPYYPKLTRTVPRALSYSSYLLIDDEIISYSGIEYKFKYTDDLDGNVKSIIRSIEKPEDIETVISEIFTEYNGRNIKFFETGKLLNVKRGLFGTNSGSHKRTGPESISNWKMLKFTKSNNSYNGATEIPRKSGKWNETLNGIKINSSAGNEMLFMYPLDDEDDSAFVKNKKKLSAQIKLGDIPKNKEGYVGVAIGMETNESGKLTNGLIVWVGAEANKKKQNTTLYVEQVKSDGTLETIVSKEDFNYSEEFILEEDNVEIFISLNEDRNKCRVLIGGTSVFQKYVETGKKKKPKVKETSFNIRRISRKSRFGVVSRAFGVGVLGQLQFGVSKDPEDLNDLDIYNIDDDYQGHKTKRPDRTYFIGTNTLLDNIVYGQNIAGLNDSSGDNFVYTGAPVGRGIRLFDVEYDTYPIIGVPRHVWEGYTYELSIFEEADLISEKEPEDIG